MKRNLIGRRFTRLLVIDEAPSKTMPNGDLKTMWRCRCDCGVIKDVDASKLVRGSTTSCSCLKVEKILAASTTHGMSRTKEHRAWNHILGRCNTATDGAYKYYGAKGIKVCARWRDFENFFADMGYAPAKHFSIERKDVHGDYTPENCIWATASEQANNKRTNILVPRSDGKRQTLAQYARENGISYKLLHKRYRKHGLEKALALSSSRTTSTP